VSDAFVGRATMFGLDRLEILFVFWAFLFQVLLIVHFALRKYRFSSAMRIGPIVYALGFPAAVISLLLLLDSKSWWLWLSGFLCLAWGIFGYTIEYLKKIQWRNPPRWQVFIPYLLLYLSTLMFYWWPVGILYRPFWFVYAFLFVTSTVLNVTSHNNK
jgi:hypothetical protein